MMPFSEFQKEELCYKINVRIETVNADPESGTDFENRFGAPQRLWFKLKQGIREFTNDEIKRMKECN